ncbi:MAG: sigma-70 family RNA polymerase sigma factor [Candidatus Latescibacterota bacterium]
MEKDSDSNLVMKCAHGDKKSFEALVERYEKPIYNIAYRVMNNGEDAMDITQNIFMKAYQKIDTFDTSRKFFSWLYRIAVNESINYSKLKHLTQEIGKDKEFAGKSPNPEESCAESEIHGYLQDAIEALDFKYKTAIVLKHFHGLSYKEMSDILEIPEKTVKSRLFTGRQLLKNILIERGYAK